MGSEEHQQPLLQQRRAEKRAFQRLHVRINGWKLVLLAIAVGILLVLFFFWRAHQQAAADAKLCRKIDRGTVALIKFVEATPLPPKGSKERKDRERFLAGERGALCDPTNLPTTSR